MASDANSVQPSSPLPPSESDLSNTSEIKEENPTQQHQQQSEDTNSNTTGLRRSSRVRKQTSHMVVVAKFSCFLIL